MGIRLSDFLLNEDGIKDQNKKHRSVVATDMPFTNKASDDKKKKIIETIKKLAHLYNMGIYSYGNFPEWVLKSWVSSDGKSAIPLKNNLWLDTKFPLNGQAAGDDEVYSGYVTDNSRTKKKGIMTLSLQKSEMVDSERLQKLRGYAQLMNWVKLAQERKHKKERIKDFREKEQTENNQKLAMQNAPQLNAGQEVAPNVGNAPQGQQGSQGGGGIEL
jgi:hypothetical protein